MAGPPSTRPPLYDPPMPRFPHSWILLFALAACTAPALAQATEFTL